MAVQLSPGVAIEEKDFSITFAGQSTSIGGFAGVFSKGPMNRIINISTANELEQIFGRPNIKNRGDFYLAKQFLQGSNSLRVVRVQTSGSLNATTGTAGVLIPNRDAYFNLLDGVGGIAFGSTHGIWAAKSAGEWANGIEVSICPAIPSAPATSQTSASGFFQWAYRGLFPSAPKTSEYAAHISRDRPNDELHIVVVDKLGKVSGTTGKVLEKFAFLSQASDAVGTDGQGIYYKDVINNQSEYIYFVSHSSQLTNAGTATTSGTGAYVVGTTPITTTLSNGFTDDEATPTEFEAAYDLFKNDDTFGVDILFSPDFTVSTEDATTISNNLISIAETTKKCIAVISTPTSVLVNKNATNQLAGALAYYGVSDSSTTTITRSSYAFVNACAVQVYDGYNNGGQYIWIPSSANDALCLARVGVSSAPAGTTKGQYLGVNKIAYNPSKADQDILHQKGVNYTLQNSRGIYLASEKTFTARASTFDQIGVRRAFIYVQKLLASFAEGFLFEFNDATTRNLLRIGSERLLQNLVTSRVIEAVRVNEPTVPSPTVIDINYEITPISTVRNINIGTFNVGLVSDGTTINVVAAEG